MTWPGNSPECRFADHLRHVCVRRDGRPVRGAEPCWYETRAQVHEAALAALAKAKERLAAEGRA